MPNDLGKKYPPVNCPRCGRRMAVEGEIVFEPHGSGVGWTRGMFQCHECIMRVKVGGKWEDQSLTFLIDADGRAFDPRDPEREIDLSRFE